MHAPYSVWSSERSWIILFNSVCGQRLAVKALFSITGKLPPSKSGATRSVCGRLASGLLAARNFRLGEFHAPKMRSRAEKLQADALTPI